MLVRRAQVKKLSFDPTQYNQGELQGNIRCWARPARRLDYEDLSTRPSQPSNFHSNLTSLDLNEQFLVVRVVKCEALPASDSSTASSDPFVRVKWDSVVQQTSTKKQTTRPVFNETFYFPVRLIDPREMIHPLLRLVG